MTEFVIPEFLENQSVDDIHQRMMENLPADIDTSEGSHPWNLTMPHAYEKAYLVEYALTEAIKLIFPKFCEGYDEIIDYHAESSGLRRKPAEYATGEVVVTGEAGTEIPVGTTFSTIAINDNPSIDFLTTEDAVIGDEGTVTIPIIAMAEGESGNVAADSIVLNASGIDNIETVTNPAATTGGMEIESTESLQARIIEHDETMDESYGGSPSDYKRWALSVNGTGSATVIRPTDDTDPITIVLTDANGDPASEELCEAVYNHIMRPDDESARLAPTNDQLEVVPPSTMQITISATVELTTGAAVAEVKGLFAEAMRAYLVTATNDREIKYTKVGSILSGITGVNDYSALLINGGTVNISISSEHAPTINESNIIFTAGTV